jgi:chaperonin GroES
MLNFSATQAGPFSGPSVAFFQNSWPFAPAAARSIGVEPIIPPHRQRRDRTMKLKPLQDRILVKRIEEATTTKGGIIIPDTAKEKPVEGQVIAVGDGKIGDDGKRLTLAVKAGDRILFGKYSGTEVKIEGEDYLIMREDDVLGIVE